MKFSKRLRRGRQVDDQLDFRRKFDRQIAALSSL